MLTARNPLLFKVPNLLRFLREHKIQKYSTKPSRRVKWLLILTFIKPNHILPAGNEHVTKHLQTLGSAMSEMLKF